MALILKTPSDLTRYFEREPAPYYGEPDEFDHDEDEGDYVPLQAADRHTKLNGEPLDLVDAFEVTFFDADYNYADFN